MVVVFSLLESNINNCNTQTSEVGELGEQETRSGYVEDPHLTYRIINNKDVFHSTLLQIRR